MIYPGAIYPLLPHKSIGTFSVAPCLSKKKCRISPSDVPAYTLSSKAHQSCQDECLTPSGSTCYRHIRIAGLTYGSIPLQHLKRELVLRPHASETSVSGPPNVSATSEVQPLAISVRNSESRAKAPPQNYSLYRFATVSRSYA